jgi:hypothetical protein
MGIFFKTPRVQGKLAKVKTLRMLMKRATLALKQDLYAIIVWLLQIGSHQHSLKKSSIYFFISPYRLRTQN